MLPKTKQSGAAFGSPITAAPLNSSKRLLHTHLTLKHPKQAKSLPFPPQRPRDQQKLHPKVLKTHMYPHCLASQKLQVCCVKSKLFLNPRRHWCAWRWGDEVLLLLTNIWLDKHVFKYTNDLGKESMKCLWCEMDSGHAHSTQMVNNLLKTHCAGILLCAFNISQQHKDRYCELKICSIESKNRKQK